MNTTSIDIPYLIAAFSYPFGLLNESYYLRKKDMKIIEVHMVDKLLHEEGGEEEEEEGSTLTYEEKMDIKEAIMAEEEALDTHISIPRIPFDKRFEIMQGFINEQEEYKDEMNFNLVKLQKAVTQKFGLKAKKKGITPGIQMDYLTYKIEDQDFQSKWQEYYQGKIEVVVLKWLAQQQFT